MRISPFIFFNRYSYVSIPASPDPGLRTAIASLLITVSINGCYLYLTISINGATY
jgi:hypothetical protein